MASASKSDGMAQPDEQMQMIEASVWMTFVVYFCC